MAKDAEEQKAHEREGSGARAKQGAAAAPPKRASRDDLRAHQEALLDEAVEETFPASDPVSVAQVRRSPR